MMTPAKKVIIMFALTLVASYISLPKEIPISINWGGIKVDKTFVRKDLNIGKVKRSFDLKYGLDLAGGSHLVFETDTNSLSADEKKQAIESLKEVIERRVNSFGLSEPNVQTSSFEGKDRIVVELPGISDTKKAVDLIGQTAELNFAELKDSEESDQTILVPSELTGADLKSAKIVYDRTTGKPAVGIEFTDEGAQKFSELTKNNIGKVIPILLDGVPVSTPVVNEQITGGSAQITGDFTVEEAKTLAVQLNAGALPVPVKLVEERTVGATLGADSVSKSITAGLIGLAMVLLFMTLVYGRFGIVANIALVIFGVITLALYKLIPVVLTLPGIAGFLLSVGMAVDSNILIFERFKEERIDRNFEDALEVSFGRAWDSIRDANISTLVTAFILANPLDWPFLHTSGPVRGFAITLSLGIAISLFTGVVVTRNLLRVFVKSKNK